MCVLGMFPLGASGCAGISNPMVLRKFFVIEKMKKEIRKRRSFCASIGNAPPTLRPAMVSWVRSVKREKERERKRETEGQEERSINREKERETEKKKDRKGETERDRQREGGGNMREFHLQIFK